MLIEAVNSELEDFKKNGVLKFKEVIDQYYIGINKKRKWASQMYSENTRPGERIKREKGWSRRCFQPSQHSS